MSRSNTPLRPQAEEEEGGNGTFKRDPLEMSLTLRFRKALGGGLRHALSRPGEGKLLDEVLAKIGLRRQRVDTDGNCLYRSLAVHVGAEWQVVKARIFHRMRTDPDLRVLFLEEALNDFPSFEAYLETKEHGTGSIAWGGYPEMVAFFTEFGWRVSVFSFNGCYSVGASAQRAAIAYVGGNHFDAVIPLHPGMAMHEFPRHWTRELHFMCEDRKVAVRKVELYDEGCITDLVAQLQLPGPSQVQLSPMPAPVDSEPMPVSPEGFEQVVIPNERVLVLIQPWIFSRSASTDGMIAKTSAGALFSRPVATSPKPTTKPGDDSNNKLVCTPNAHHTDCIAVKGRLEPLRFEGVLSLLGNTAFGRGDGILLLLTTFHMRSFTAQGHLCTAELCKVTWMRSKIRPLDPRYFSLKTPDMKLRLYCDNKKEAQMVRDICTQRHSPPPPLPPQPNVASPQSHAAPPPVANPVPQIIATTPATTPDTGGKSPENSRPPSPVARKPPVTPTPTHARRASTDLVDTPGTPIAAGFVGSPAVLEGCVRGRDVPIVLVTAGTEDKRRVARILDGSKPAEEPPATVAGKGHGPEKASLQVPESF